MHHHIAIMLQHLCCLLAHRYCGQQFLIKELTKEFYCHCLVPAIAAYLKIEEQQLFSEETFWRASHKRPVGTATLERFALLYYAHIDKKCVAITNKEYQRLIKLKELHYTPNWNRFKEEYKAKHEKEKAAELPKDWFKLIDRLSKKDLQKLELRIRKRREKEMKKIDSAII